ncbi:MAG: DUF6345 domain-containing protein [Alphaproteobacteria bacterium]
MLLIRSKSRAKTLAFPLALVAATLFSPMVNAGYEAKSYAITTWNAGCAGGTRSYWDDMADAWYDEITDKGFSFFGWCWWGHCNDAYSRDGQYVNGNIVNSKFADSSVVPWGNDTSHLDEGDAVMMALHGWEGGNNYGGRVRVNEAGGGDCDIRRSEMQLGDSDLEFLHLSSCQSMDDNQWSTWWQAFNGVHQVDGFHGLMWIGSGLVNDYQDFADDAFSSTIADAWLDNMYVPNISGNDDQCPVAYAVGANSADTWNRIGTERYDNVHSDPNTIGYWGVIFIGGCDPAAETVITSDYSS